MKKKIISLKIGDTFKTSTAFLSLSSGYIIELYSYSKQSGSLTLMAHVPGIKSPYSLYLINEDEFKRALTNGEIYQEEL